jgi:hypothetical protein
VLASVGRALSNLYAGLAYSGERDQ